MNKKIQLLIEKSFDIFNKSYIKYCPNNKKELRLLIKKLLRERGPNANLNDIDTSKITDMSNLFKNLNPYNVDISAWNVSNVKNMNCMFYECINFNSDISNWNVSNVKHMNFMFDGCSKFNCNLNNWNIKNVRNMLFIFDNCKSLKSIPIWNNL